MDFIIDASSVINLDNAEAIKIVTGLVGHSLWISPLVIGECEPRCAATLFSLQQAGALHFVDPNDISSERFLDLLSQHQLGEGETECIALCLTKPFTFCCDDNKARQLAGRLFGEQRVIGSIRLIKWCANANLITGPEAVAIYERMRAAGGFLPAIRHDWFLDGKD